MLVENHPGVLSRYPDYLAEGDLIFTTAVGITEISISRITIVVEGDDYTVEQVTKQLNKLIDVIKVSKIGQDSVTRELALIKVKADRKSRHEVIEIINVFRAQIVDIARDYLIVEITGDSDKISAMVDMLNDYEIKEMVRTGAIALDRGSKMIKYEDTDRGGCFNGNNVL